MTVTVTAAPEAEHVAPAGRADVSVLDIVDVWGQDSFPASDAPANW